MLVDRFTVLFFKIAGQVRSKRTADLESLSLMTFWDIQHLMSKSQPKICENLLVIRKWDI